MNATKTDRFEWNRGWHQAAADAQTEGDIRGLYCAASIPWLVGYAAYFETASEAAQRAQKAAARAVATCGGRS